MIVKKYLSRIEGYSIWRFILEGTFWALVLKFVSGLLIDLIFPNFENDPGFKYWEEKFETNFGPFLIFSIILILPALETLLGQVLPVKAVSFFTKNRWAAIITSTLIFASFHGFSLYFLFVLPLGVIFAYAFIVQGEKSFWRGFFVTFAIHSLHNLIALIVSTLFVIE